MPGTTPIYGFRIPLADGSDYQVPDDIRVPVTSIENIIKLVSDTAAKRIQVGTTLVTPVANVPTSLSVVFAVPFLTAPTVVATANTGVPGNTVMEVSVTAITATGFDIVVYRNNNTGTFVGWIAVVP